MCAVEYRVIFISVKLFLSTKKFQVVRDVSAINEHLASCDDEILSLHGAARALQVELASKATLIALRECVTRRHYEQAVAALGSEIELKAAQTAVSDLQGRLKVRTNK